MTKKKIYAIKLTIFFGVLFIVFIICKMIHFEKTSITLKQAYEMAYKVASAYNEDIMLDYLTSVDIEGEQYNNDGNSGRRRNWNMDFAIPGTTEHFIVQIRNGRISNYQSIVGLCREESDLVQLNQVNFDSDYLFEIAQGYYEIIPGEQWAIGYHYTLHKQDGNAEITLVCYDIEHNLCNIKLNAEIGEILSGKSKVRVGGGIVDDEGNIILNCKYQVNTIFPLEEQNQIIASGYRFINEIEYQPLIILLTKDSVKEFEISNEVYSFSYIDGNLCFVDCEGIWEFDYESEIIQQIYSCDVLAYETTENIITILTHNSIIIMDNDRKLLIYNINEFEGIDFTNITDISVYQGSDIILSTRNSIYRYRQGNIMEIESCSESIIDVKCLDDILYIITEQRVKAYDLKNEYFCIDIDNSLHAKEIILGNNEECYTISSTNENVIYINMKGGEEIVQKIPNYGVVTDLCILSTNRKIFSYFSNYEWQDMPERKVYE